MSLGLHCSAKERKVLLIESGLLQSEALQAALGRRLIDWGGGGGLMVGFSVRLFYFQGSRQCRGPMIKVLACTRSNIHGADAGGNRNCKKGR